MFEYMKLVIVLGAGMNSLIVVASMIYDYFQEKKNQGDIDLTGADIGAFKGAYNNDTKQQENSSESTELPCEFEETNVVIETHGMISSTND